MLLCDTINLAANCSEIIHDLSVNLDYTSNSPILLIAEASRLASLK